MLSYLVTSTESLNFNSENQITPSHNIQNEYKSSCIQKKKTGVPWYSNTRLTLSRGVSLVQGLSARLSQSSASVTSTYSLNCRMFLLRNSSIVGLKLSCSMNKILFNGCFVASQVYSGIHEKTTQTKRIILNSWSIMVEYKTFTEDVT